MPDLTVPQLIERLTLDAANHRQLAKGLEEQAAALKKIHETYNGSLPKKSDRIEPTIEVLISAIKGRESTRVGQLADQFGVTSETILRIISGAKDRIRSKGAGWLEVTEDSAVNSNPAEETPV